MMEAFPQYDGHVNVHRRVVSLESMVDIYDLSRQYKPTLKERLKDSLRHKFCCTRLCVQSFFLSLFPFITVLKDYKWKKWFYLDVIAGISVGVIHIPQGMGFALLTTLQPVYGLYSSFFPVLLYFFFGTSRHISVGTMALTSLMIGAVVDREILLLCPDQNEVETLGNVTHSCDVERTKADIAISVSLIVGCFQLAMGICSLGIIATFMSMSFVGGFLVGAACHIITSQMSSVFGVKIPKYPGTFRIPLTFYQLFANITQSNVSAIITAAISITLLVVMKEIINEKCKSKMKIPIPAELIVVVLGTLISYLTDLHGKFGLQIVKDIPRGIPPPRVPPMMNATTYIGDSFLVSLVSFAISISMAKMMAQKHKYKIDVNQELVAYGIIHGTSSFFNCFAGCQAPPRTLVHDGIGGKSQVASLISCALLLLVLMVLAPLFYSLPRPVLSSVIIVALLPMFKQMKDLPNIGRINPIDLIVWIITFLAVIILDISLGLFIGLGISVFLVVLQGHLVNSEVLVGIEDSELYVAKEEFGSKRMLDAPGIQVFKFTSSLYFVNVEKYKTQLLEKTVNYIDLMKSKKSAKTQENGNVKDIDSDHQGNDSHTTGENLVPTHTLVLDCSCVSYIDLMGVNMLKGLGKEYDQVDIDVYLACCRESVLSKLQKVDAIFDSTDSENSAGKLKVFPSVLDAVTSASCPKPKINIIKATYL